MFNFQRTRRSTRQDSNVPAPTPVNWRRLFGYLQPHRARMGLAIAALVIAQGFGLAFPLVIVQLLDTVLKAQSQTQLNQFTLLLIAVLLLQSAFTVVQTYNLNYIGERIVLELRTTLYRHLHALSLDFFATRRVGELLSRISSDVTQVRSLLSNNIATFLSSSISLVGSLVIVFLLNSRLVGFVLVLALVIIGVAVGFGRYFQKFSTTVQDSLAEATVAAEEGLQGMRVVKSFTRETYEVGRYTKAMHKTLDAALRLAFFRSAFFGVMAFLGFGAIAVILWYSGREVLLGRLEFSTITGFLIYAITISTNLGQLSNLYGQYREALGSVQRVFEILDTKPVVADSPNATVLPPVQGAINFDDISFGYEANQAVLKGISLAIAPGEIVALVGPSGAGKSTLFNLIPRFYDPTEGTVRIDGIDVRTVTQESLRSQIGLVPQETILFGGTIRENILYGRLDASEEELIAAATAANAHDFIRELPSGYDTIVGERGIKLSGGQRQRLAIARAILKDPRILLLDEATSSLDSESEELVQDALNRLMQGRTAVIIAHRLSTIKVAHRILVLDHGAIVEQGTHDELMAQNGLYAHLYTLQFRTNERADRPVDEPALSLTA